jgi:hypothetical protein
MMENKEIAARFLEAKAVNFDAIGKLVTELGPELARADVGQKMVLVGGRFVVACWLTARESALIGLQFQNAQLGREVLGE